MRRLQSTGLLYLQSTIVLNPTKRRRQLSAHPHSTFFHVLCPLFSQSINEWQSLLYLLVPERKERFHRLREGHRQVLLPGNDFIIFQLSLPSSFPPFFSSSFCSFVHSPFLPFSLPPSLSSTPITQHHRPSCLLSSFSFINYHQLLSSPFSLPCKQPPHIDARSSPSFNVSSYFHAPLQLINIFQ